ncbi:MAG: hypothetical protein U0800_13175 [Isosphaeraceae bacterium]
MPRKSRRLPRPEGTHPADGEETPAKDLLPFEEVLLDALTSPKGAKSTWASILSMEHGPEDGRLDVILANLWKRKPYRRGEGERGSRRHFGFRTDWTPTPRIWIGADIATLVNEPTYVGEKLRNKVRKVMGLKAPKPAETMAVAEGGAL